jgi:drug/metabolite transporter (DMT)-like permease
LAQATAFVFSSLGVSGGFPPFSATLIRISAGILALWAFIALQRNLTSTATIFKNDLRLFFQLAGAALSGPVIAGSLLLLSFQLIPVGVSTTLSHTTAIILIPIGYFVFKERITLRAIIGTIVTIVGIGILFS